MKNFTDLFYIYKINIKNIFLNFVLSKGVSIIRVFRGTQIS